MHVVCAGLVTKNQQEVAASLEGQVCATRAR
jgi:hypothetical protein